MSQIWLIRHAESRANAGEKTTDPGTIGLTEKGYKQAGCLANAFERKPHLIVTSPYLRTKQTAEPLIERFPDVEQQEWSVQEFTYLCPERCRNTTAQERRPLAEEYWARCDPSFNDGIGAESFADFMNRVEGFIGQAKSPENEFTAVFSHGQFIRAILWRLVSGKSEVSPVGMKRFNSFMTSIKLCNAGTVKLRGEKDGSLWVSSIESSYLPLEFLT